MVSTCWTCLLLVLPGAQYRVIHYITARLYKYIYRKYRFVNRSSLSSSLLQHQHNVNAMAVNFDARTCEDLTLAAADLTDPSAFMLGPLETTDFSDYGLVNRTYVIVSNYPSMAPSSAPSEAITLSPTSSSLETRLQERLERQIRRKLQKKINRNKNSCLQGSSSRVDVSVTSVGEEPPPRQCP